MLRNVLISSVVGLGFIAGPAQGAMLQAIGTTQNYVTPAHNNVMAGVNGFIGGNLFFADAADIVWTFLGKEAGYTNTLIAGGCSIASSVTPGSSAATCTSSHSGGALQWQFTVWNPWMPGFMPSVNPGNNSPTSNASVFFSIINASEFYIALDDGGAGPDDNHDDWFGRGRIVPRVVSVPEPGALALFGALALASGIAMRGRART
jgi:hypothetical protein